MTTKILIMGLPGSGKTTFSHELVKRLMMNHTVTWYNADVVREQANDWDFSDAGRYRQVQRMRDLADASELDFVVCDFVCPTEELREVFDADIVIWMDTIREGRYTDTNKLFQPPSNCTYRITDWDKHWVDSISSYLSKHGESHKRSFLKAVSWRTLGTADTFILSWVITGSVNIAAAIGGVELITKTALYYLHERAWARIKIR
jgi:adenylylsulfate kinase